jgi:hypothetical protein
VWFIAAQQKTLYTRSHAVIDPGPAGRFGSHPNVCLLHLLHWWIQPKAAMPWAFFWASVQPPSGLFAPL